MIKGFVGLMRRGRAVLWAGMVGVIVQDGAWSQVVPATPRKWGTRSTSGSGSASIDVDVVDPVPRKVRETTYIVLSPLRGFTSADGRKLQGKLIAFEQSVVERDEAPAGQKEPVAKEPAAGGGGVVSPAKVTVVKNGKVRLWVNSKVFEYPLDQLADEDRRYIEGVRVKVEVPREAAGSGK